MTILLKKQINNLKTEGFTDVERFVNVTSVHIDGGEFNQIILDYYISYQKDGVDVSHLFRTKTSYNWIINNSQQVMQRDENFQPVMDENNQPIMLPAFDYIMGIFNVSQAIPYSILNSYIDINDADGLFDL